MSSNKKKDNKNNQKTKYKSGNESVKATNSSKDTTSVPKPFNTSDPSFLETMEQLVSNDKEIREKAAQKAKEYMKESYSNTEELYEKISRSLFYFYWNTDKSAYQLAMAKLIASFIYINEDDKTKLIPKHKLWITTFLSEISNKFQKIDVLRLDKYIMMCDQVISTYLTACLENKFYKSIINLVKYFIREIDNNNNFNFTFESNKIKVISRFVKLLLQENSDDKNELKNKEDYLNDEENGFIMFYKKLLMLYMTIKDKREIKNFAENIFDMLIKELVDNKKENNNIINKIKEKSELFLKENKPQLNGPKILAMQYFINKLKDEKFQKPVKEDSNVVDPVNDYIMKKNYMVKFKKSKEEIKKERLLEKEKKKELKNKQKEKEKEKEKENDDIGEKKENLKKSDKKDKKDKKEENLKNSDKKDKKEKLNKLEDISKELDFENVKEEKELINLEEGEDKSEENEKENKKDNNKQNKLENKKEKKDKKEDKKQNENKQKEKEKEKEKEKKINKEDKKDKDKKKDLKNKEKNFSDDDSLIEDTDEDEEEELIEENVDDDDDDSENNNNDKMGKNKKLKDKIKFGKEEEDLDNNEEDEIDNEEDMMEEDDLDDEEYEVNEDDLEDYGNDLNLMFNSYSDKNTLKNTQINIKQGLLNKKTQRNFYRNNVNKNKKKKISFSLENNVVSIYNSKVPITLTSKKKNVFVQGGTNKQSLLKKNK